MTEQQADELAELRRRLADVEARIARWEDMAAKFLTGPGARKLARLLGIEVPK